MYRRSRILVATSFMLILPKLNGLMRRVKMLGMKMKHTRYEILWVHYDPRKESIILFKPVKLPLALARLIDR